MISNSEEIKDAAQIADILGDFITLKKKGVNYTACCPFHTEKRIAEDMHIPVWRINDIIAGKRCKYRCV